MKLKFTVPKTSKNLKTKKKLHSNCFELFTYLKFDSLRFLINFLNLIIPLDFCYT